jgi:DNA modification methylase
MWCQDIINALSAGLRPMCETVTLSETPLIRAYNMDCMEAMPGLADNSVDMVLLDPPYNIGKADWDKWKKQSSYVEWLGSVFIECQRVLKDNGSFYWFHNDMEQITDLMLWIRQNTKFVFKQMITWTKISERFKNLGFVNQRLAIDSMRNYYNGFTEYILFYTFQDETGLTTVMLDTNNFSTLRQYFKEYQEALGLNKLQILEKVGQKADHCFRWSSSQWDLPTEETYKELEKLPLKHQFARCEYKDLCHEYELVRREYEDLRREYEDLRYTFNTEIVRNHLRANGNVWEYPPAQQNGHVTPKPIPLIENILKHSTNEGYTILDPMMGSGTTGVACWNLNRNFIGIEKNQEYFDAACTRFERETRQHKLFPTSGASDGNKTL